MPMLWHNQEHGEGEGGSEGQLRDASISGAPHRAVAQNADPDPVAERSDPQADRSEFGRRRDRGPGIGQIAPADITPWRLPSVRLTDVLTTRGILPRERAVYFILSSGCQVLYIGSTVDLSQRFLFGNIRYSLHHKFVQVLQIEAYARIHWFLYGGDIRRLEKQCIAHFAPLLNVEHNLGRGIPGTVRGEFLRYRAGIAATGPQWWNSPAGYLPGDDRSPLLTAFPANGYEAEWLFNLPDLGFGHISPDHFTDEWVFFGLPPNDDRPPRENRFVKGMKRLAAFVREL